MRSVICLTAATCLLLLTCATFSQDVALTPDSDLPAQQQGDVTLPDKDPLTQQPPAALAKDAPRVCLQCPDVFRQGQSVKVTVRVSDPDLVSVALALDCDLLRIGGKSRGRVRETIAGPQKLGECLADGIREIEFTLTPGYYDSTTLDIKAKAFRSDGSVGASAGKKVAFVPRVIPEKLLSGVVVSKKLQRLFAAKDGRLTAAFVVSTGRKHSDGGGPTPSMVTRIRNKSVNARSRKYGVDMRYWNAITSDGRYGIHATYPKLYKNLGRPDSHGCIRLHLVDARKFYTQFPVGTPIYVVD